MWKPSGMHSTTATMKIRRIVQGDLDKLEHDEMIFRNRSDYSSYGPHLYKVKVGHGGTLDSFAEGILVIGIGRECKKLSYYLSHTDKEYTVSCELGRMTDTLDTNGIVVKKAPWEHIVREELERVLNDFRGNILQTPPMWSAKRVGGERLSDIAHRARMKGIDSPVSPKPIQVTIKSLELLSFNPPHFSLSVCCSSGTYMRSLARDIGMRLDSVGYATSVKRDKTRKVFRR